MSKSRSLKKLNSLTQKPWTQKQDEILKEILQDDQNKKWTEISKVLEERYGVKNRSAKDCEERWINHLEPSLKADFEWSDTQQKQMFKYHSQFGNKWAKIAQYMKGRTDNDVKNYFYCCLRRGFRKMNKYLSARKRKTGQRQMKMAVLSKIIAVADDKFQKKIGVPEQIIQMSQLLKRKLFKVSKQAFKLQGNEQKIQQLVGDILKFNKSYRKKKKAKANPKQKSKTKSKQIIQEQSQQQPQQEQQVIQKQQSIQNLIRVFQDQDLPGQQKIGTSNFKNSLQKDSSGFDFLKSRIGSGSMDFWKISRSGSDLVSINRQAQLNQVTTRYGVNKKHSLQIPMNNMKLMSRSVQQMLQNKPQYLQIPNLIIPSFDSNYIASLTSGSGDLTNMLQTQRRTSLIYNAVNPLTSEMKKIESGDFQYFYNNEPK